MDNSVLAEFIGTRPFDEQIKLLELVAHSRDTAAVNYAGSVLDSGSILKLTKHASRGCARGNVSLSVAESVSA